MHAQQDTAEATHRGAEVGSDGEYRADGIQALCLISGLAVFGCEEKNI